MTSVVQAAETVAPIAAANADRSERARQLDPEVVAALRGADLFRLCVPAGLGGMEASPRELVEAVETLGRSDASVAWVLAVTATSGLLAAYLDESSAGEVYGSSGVAVGGVFAPRGQAVSDGDALKVSGRWTFASGSTFCDWLLGGCMIEDREPRLVLFPRDGVQVHDTWTVSGLRATGSHDFSVDGVRVPAGRAAGVVGTAPRDDGPLYAFPLFGLLALAIAGVSLGIARGALTDVTAFAAAKRPEGSARLLGERSTVQAEIARAEAGLRAARALLMDEIDHAWELARGNGQVSVDTRMSLRLAATHATRASRNVVDSAWDVAGGSSLYESAPFARRFRDVHAASQHMLVSPATWELTGRLLLGVPTDTGQL